MFRIRPLAGFKPFTQIIIFTGILGSCLLFSSLLGILLLMVIYGPDSVAAVSNPSLYSTPSVIASLKIIQIVNQAFGLLFPAVLFALFASRNPGKYLRFGTRQWPVMMIASAALIVTAQPVIGWLGEMNARLVLPESLSGLETWLENSEQQAARLTEAFLSTTTYTGLAVNVLMIGILPALAEEIVFRGVLQRLFGKLVGNMHWGIIISAIIFAGIHLQFYGFLPRFALGLVFGYLFLWTGNLWIPITAHFINNLLSVSTEFLFRKGLIGIDSTELGNTGNIFLIVAAFIISGLLLFWFQRKRSGADLHD